MSKYSNHNFFIVTVNYNSWDDCRAFMETFDGNFPVKRVIIVDHSAPTSVPPIESNLSFQTVAQPNRGYAAGLNRGLREIREQEGFALLCNPDVRLISPDNLSKALIFMSENPDVICLAPSLLDAEGTRAFSCRQFYSPATIIASRIAKFGKAPPKLLREHLYLDKDNGIPREVDWVSGAAMLVRLPVVPEEVFFDERFFLYFEDVDFCAQVWKKGYKVIYYPQPTFVHTANLSSRHRLRYVFIHIWSLIKFIHKYNGLPARERLMHS